MSNKIVKYSIYMRVIHWVMSFMIIGLGVGVHIIDEFCEPSEASGDIYYLHKSFGMLIIPLAIVRLTLRFCNHAPKLPGEIKGFEKILSKLGVIALYSLMFAIPLSGYMMCDASGDMLKIFGINMPSFFDNNRSTANFFYSIHEWIWYVFLLMLSLHVTYSLKHLVCEKVNLFRRIW